MSAQLQAMSRAMGMDLKPAFQVKDVSHRTVTSKVVRRDPKLGLVYEDKEVQAGYMVFFPHGHSIHVDKAELSRLHFTHDASIVDMKTGEVVPPVGEVSLEELSNRKTQKTRRNGGLASLVDDADLDV